MVGPLAVVDRKRRRRALKEQQQPKERAHHRATAIPGNSGSRLCFLSSTQGILDTNISLSAY